MNIIFTRPEYLWFLVSLPVLVLIHIWSLKFIKRKALKFANFEAIEKITGQSILSRNITLLFFRLLIIMLFIFSAAGTVLWYTGMSSDFDFVLAVDASSSMLADDYEPNRLKVAKDSALTFIDTLESKANIAVMTFAGVTYLKQGLTDDKEKVKEVINSIDIEHAGGTAVGVAIQEGTNKLIESDKAKVIVLLTDGQNNVGVQIDDGIRYANEHGVMVHTIGVASREGGSFEGIDFISTLDEEGLKRIADETGGKYFHVGSEEELDVAFVEIATSTEQKLSHKLEFTFMIFAIMLLFIEWILQNTRYRTIP